MRLPRFQRHCRPLHKTPPETFVRDTQRIPPVQHTQCTHSTPHIPLTPPTSVNPLESWTKRGVVGYLIFVILMLLAAATLGGCSRMEMSYKDFSDGKPITDMAVKVETPILFSTVNEWEIAFEQKPDGSQSIVAKGEKSDDGASWLELLGAAIIGGITAWFTGGATP